LFHEPLAAVARLSWSNERYTHILLVPLISLGLLFLRRQRIFAQTQYSPRVGLLLLGLAALLYAAARGWSSPLGLSESLALSVGAIVLICLAGFVLFFGARPFLEAIFPLCFLLLVVPIPSLLLDRAVFVLQQGSAETAHLLFKVSGMPVFRDGFTFALPGMSIEVAEECSGLRSTVALVITGLLAGHLFLRSAWTKLFIVLFTIPLSIFKNGIRITTLSWLAVRINPEYLTGKLHHQYGGLVFSLVALSIFVPVLFALQRFDTPKTGGAETAGAGIRVPTA
jgi:exosortase